VKTSQDPRHLKRESIVKELFTWSFTDTYKLQTEEAKEITEALNKIDKEIETGAPSWPINQINRIDLAILRLAVFELIIVKDTPFKVVVDEAVEMAKKYGAETSPSFINGVLGNIITAHKLDKKKK
jgi:N utilization substance protein B